jgi:PAS domain S-box-containing protein
MANMFGHRFESGRLHKATLHGWLFLCEYFSAICLFCRVFSLSCDQPILTAMPHHTTTASFEDIAAQNSFLLQVLLNNTESSFILADKNLNIVFFNKLADQWSSQFVGIPLHAGMPLLNLASPDRKDQQLQLLKETLKGHHSEIEYGIDLPGTDYVCFYNAYYPAKNDEGEIIGVLVTSKDITERKKREEELRISNERFNLIVKATSDAIWDYDVLSSQVYFNESFTKYFGYQLSGWGNDYDLWERHIHPDDRERVIAKINESIKGNASHWEDEYRFLTNDGSVSYVYDRGMILRNASGEAVRLIGSMQDITRLKENEIKIALSEHRFRSLVQSGTDLIGIVDAAGNYTYTSHSVKQLGYELESLLGKNAFDYIHPDDLGMTQQFLHDLLHQKQLATSPFRFKAANGEWRWIETIATNLLDDPAINGIVINSRDITEKKQKEEELQKTLNDLHKILDSSVDVIVVTDDKNRFIQVSAAAETVWGYTPVELIGKVCLDLVHPDDVESTNAATERVMKGARVTNFQNRYIRKDGTAVPLIWSARWDKQENVMYAIARDASEKIEAETALKKSEAMFRAISESFPNGIVNILNRHLQFEYVAGKELEILGLTPAYFVGTLYSQHFPDDDLFIRSTADRIFRGETVVSELKFLQRNYLVSSVPLYEPDGSIERILVVAQNITPHKKVQKEKEMLISELTKNIQDLRQFSYITSHNLRAPISNLIGIMNLIDIATIEDPDTAFLVSKFKESTYILNETVNDLLNILLIKNNVNVKKEVFSLQQVWQGVCTSVNSQIKKAGAVINADFSHDDEIIFNKAYAESILLNLLTNSLKYRDKDRQLNIKLTTTKDDDYIILHFHDNGIGINLDHHREKIFGLYQRFHNYPDSKGLGLYIVHSQVTALGGKIEVESEANKGTCFKVYFKK